jgi:hypothetical protein
MNKPSLRKLAALTTSLSFMASLGFLNVGNALGTAPKTTTKTSTGTTQQVQLQTIISRGTAEINRRLTVLASLTSKVSTTTKLTAADKTTLATELTTETSGLTQLKAGLSADTTVSAAKAAAQTIFTDYRVFALIVPKVYLVQTADQQQTVAAKLTALAIKLQAKVGTSASVAAMTTEVQAANTISSSIESKVVVLQPSDYNTEHTILSGDRDQLKTAQADLKLALSDAQSLISTLKS